jgi:cation diffusion facilitator family transporter
LKGVLRDIFVPHSHHAADSVDDALESNRAGIRALKISLVILGVTTLLQAGVVAISGSVALLADTIHNFSDALTAVPLWVAFVLGRRAATRRYTFGFGRAEDLAGLFIILVVAVSVVVAAWQSIDRLLHPRPIENLWWVLAAGVIGFAGNEAVAIYRIRVGKQIGSAVLVADGVHARADGFTSLAVVFGAIGVLLGFPLADPIVGLTISAAILVLLVGTVRSIGRRLMDGIESTYVEKAEAALVGTAGVRAVHDLKLRWVGHRMHGSARLTVGDGALSELEGVARQAHHALEHTLPNLGVFDIRLRSTPPTLHRH